VDAGVRDPVARGVRVATLAVLALAALQGLVGLYRFGQERFFTIDEYQYGHATWLVSQGQKPYVDFYEHHFPLSYVAHAPLVGDDAGFVVKALRLRAIVFAYLVGLSAVLVLATGAVTRSAHGALLAAILPLGVGFGRMSAIEYRADTFAACLWVACLALLEANRRWGRRSVSALCAVLFAASLLMTQKMIAVAGGTLAVLAAVDGARWLRGGGRPGSAAFLRFPVCLAAVAGSLLVAAVAIGGWLGLLPAAFEATVLDAIQHERVYPTTAIGLGDYLAPFWQATWGSTTPILLLAALFLALGRSGLWAVALLVAAAAAGLARAQYPYNYIFVSIVVGLCAVRGCILVVEWIPLRSRRAASMRPLLYLAPLLLLPDQLGFLDRASGNGSQLTLLRKIEAFSREDDAVIDDAGGALFRPHGSYFWYHGKAHQQIFADYFERELVKDYRRSRALFWIADFRLRELPQSVRDFWARHYVRADRNLYTLGFVTPRTGDAPSQVEIDVIREGDYHVHPAPAIAARRGGRGEAPARLRIDGREVASGTVHLGEGPHRIAVPPGSPPMVLSLLPPEGFEPWVTGPGHHMRLFEYRDRIPGGREG
jgi:hypothetical protein